jgi:hypothetical protein
VERRYLCERSIKQGNTSTSGDSKARQAAAKRFLRKLLRDNAKPRVS